MPNPLVLIEGHLVDQNSNLIALQYVDLRAPAVRLPIDLPPMFVPPVMLVRQAQEQGRQARVPQAPAAGSPASCAA